MAADYDAPGGANAPDVVEAAVQALADLADGGPVLEFAVGTGRIAAPLAARGAPVKGIELSRAMGRGSPTSLEAKRSRSRSAT